MLQGMLRTPTRIEPADSSHCRIDWNTGESFTIPYVELRFECPCAMCVDEKTGKRILRREQVANDVRPLDVQIVGRYAVRIQWSDSHSTGMFHFDRLFELCTSLGKR